MAAVMVVGTRPLCPSSGIQGQLQLHSRCDACIRQRPCLASTRAQKRILGFRPGSRAQFVRSGGSGHINGSRGASCWVVVAVVPLLRAARRNSRARGYSRRYRVDLVMRKQELDRNFQFSTPSVQPVVPKHGIEAKESPKSISHLSYLTPSMIADFKKCPKFFEYRYVLKLKEKRSFAATRGSLVHEVLDKLFDLPPAERTLAKAHGISLDVFRSEYAAYFAGHQPDLPRARLQNFWREVNQALGRYFEVEDPTKQDSTRATELRVEMKLPGVDPSEGLGGLKGRLDRLDVDDFNMNVANHCTTIVDYKTASKPDDPRVDLRQLTLYALMLQGASPEPMNLKGHLVYLGEKHGNVDCEFSPQSLREAEEDVTNTRAEILKAARSPDGFQPNFSRMCSFCSFREECKREVESQRPQVEEGVTIVRSREDADRVMAILLAHGGKYFFHAIDTETDGWEPGDSTYSKGRVICFSVYCGPSVDFGAGPRLWVDNLDDAGNETGMVEYFRPYLENPDIQKVFHNYSFDRAMFYNMGINIACFAADTMHMARLWDSDCSTGYSLKNLSCELLDRAWQKQTGYGELQDGGFGAAAQMDPEKRDRWIEYSALDAVATWHLHAKLSQELKKRTVISVDDLLKATNKSKATQASSSSSRSPDRNGPPTMLEFYDACWRPFGDMLVRLEQKGIHVDKQLLESQGEQAEKDVREFKEKFEEWLQRQYLKRWPDEPELAEQIVGINAGSRQQLGQLLFGFKGDEVVIDKIRIRSLDLPKKTIEFTPTGQPKVDDEALGRIAELEGCEGLSYLRKMFALKKLISFMDSYKSFICPDGRIHSTFQLYTGTGRLSSSSPNLQQVPALDKDTYGLRRIFCAEDGRRLIVADYAQLELRILAHLTRCALMIDALIHDGDLHSRTATNMFKYIREAVDRGEVAIEGHDSGMPLVKDVYPSERKKAKAVTFGIMYGLTKYGLARQWDCSLDEAQDTIDKWYEANPEVGRWQAGVKAAARKSVPVHVNTIRGRWRQIYDSTKDAYGAADRKMINAPVQGSAADVVVEAMLKVDRDEVMRELGYEMILQVHDELVLEGPEENADQALDRLKELMEHPFVDGKELLVPLTVDGCVCKSWGEAK